MEERNFANFVEVVIFGGHPENGDGVDSLLGQVFCDAYSSDGLVHGVAGAAKEPDLLTGDDGDRAFFQAVEIGAGRWAGTKQLILLAENRGDFNAAFGWKLQVTCNAQ